MLISTGTIVFQFAKCGCHKDAKVIDTDLYSILEAGTPICPECGNDLEVLPFAEIKSQPVG